MDKILLLQNQYYKWWKNLDKFIFFLIILLFLIGLFFSLVSTSLLVSDKLDTNDYAFLFKHLSFVFLGILIIFILSSINLIIFNIFNISFINPLLKIFITFIKNETFFSFHYDTSFFKSF